ncbi:MAG: hypothetical protein R3D84_04200 [Paracoccaceae bacterium]
MDLDDPFQWHAFLRRQRRVPGRTGGTWRLVNGEYCRAVKAKGNAETCSAYRLGDVYRFTDSGDSASWRRV